MKVKIRTGNFRFFVPLPVTMIGFAVRCMPDKVIGDWRRNMPEPYCQLVTKEYISMILEACLSSLKENKGLEVVHVETQDGTYVSIKL